MSGNRRHFRGRGQKVDHRVEQRLHASVAQRRATHHRHRLARQRHPSHRRSQGWSIDGRTGQKQLGHHIIDLADSLDQLLARGTDDRQIFVGGVGDFGGSSSLPLKVMRFCSIRS
jgi:hypothetical protein